jgi:serine/threonine protein kinase
MRITNCGTGIHQREISGIEQLQSLPNEWYAYTNLDIVNAPGTSREIDVILVADDRIFLIDIKDWAGSIESRDGNWFQNGADRGYSPVAKIARQVRQLHIMLDAHIKKHSKGEKVLSPLIQGMVLLARHADTSGISETEISNVMTIKKFITDVSNVRTRVSTFGGVSRSIVDNPLTGTFWKGQLSKFFNVSKGVFAPGRRDYGGYFATSEDAVFVHPRSIFAEYDASDERRAPRYATLRLWDFSKAEVRFQGAEGRAEIVGREQQIATYLRDRSDRCEEILLDMRARDLTDGPAYWEVVDRPRRILRLADFALSQGGDLPREAKIELARQLLSAIDALHLADASHLDIGGHSIWLSRPSTVRLSHLMAASYPDVATLGETRYQFLSSALLPEDALGDLVDPKRKDIFLLGVAIHRLLLGSSPATKLGNPPEWNSEADKIGDYKELHSWFARALAWNAVERFSDAGIALVAFNDATAVRPTPKEVLAGLEGFRGEVRSQFALYKKYPPELELRDDERLAMWRSSIDHNPVIVKLWKRACWGDQQREGPRILGFLNRMRELALTSPAGCARILEAFWLGDAIVMVQEWVDRKDLACSLIDEPEHWRKDDRALSLCRSLVVLVENLHERGTAHGDLKPANILVDPQAPADPILVDLAEFTAVDDGEAISRAYAPPLGGRFERDRFAVTRIVEEMLSVMDLAPDAIVRLNSAIATVRDSEPANATLSPVMEALSDLNELPSAAPIPINIAVQGSTAGSILPDEGHYYIRRTVGRTGYIFRGACEEIEIETDAMEQPFRARRRSLDQSRISMLTRHEFGTIVGLINVDVTTRTDLRAISNLLGQARNLWQAASPEALQKIASAENSSDEAIEEIGDTELLEDALEEEIAQSSPPDGNVDVATLWEQLIKVEREMTTEGVALGESAYRRDIKRHLVPFELESGAFEYRRDDRVMIERLDRHGAWRPLGDLDLQRSKPDLLAIDASRFVVHSGRGIVDESQRLRFKSHFEETSLQRRNDAVMRITSGRARLPNLIEVFDPARQPEPDVSSPFERDALADRYDLNGDQAEALSRILSTRPLGLLQGPPGTGKTVFISALVHAALTSGLARNVLLASQSHEAVNNAAEAVLKIFGSTGEAPSIIRVGHEGNVSERLLPFHAGRVEQLYKDRFQATMRERLRVAGVSLGIPADLSDQLTFVENAIRPVTKRLMELTDSDLPDVKERINGLRQTLNAQLNTIDMALIDLGEIPPQRIADEAGRLLAARLDHERRPSPDRLARFRASAKLAKDFVSSVSTEKRSFDTFLAGTRQIVVGTCVGLGRASLGLTTTRFDLVIVDEAARCTASELAVPMQAGTWIVLVGDQAQLEPQHDADVVINVAETLAIPKAEVVRSDFERVFLSGYGRSVGCSLKVQYRMLAPIGRLVSTSFYDGMLAHGREEPVIPRSALPEDLASALVWVETDGLGDEAHQKPQESGKSLINTVEADGIISLLRRWSEHEPFMGWLEQPSEHGYNIGIICAYAAQRDLIRRKLQRAGLPIVLVHAVKIDTIDSYQGKENPIVLLSLVRNNKDGPIQNGISTIRPGFMARPNRINVAMSRAMDRLVIIGARRRWHCNQPMGSVVEAFDAEQAKGAARTIDIDILLPPTTTTVGGKAIEAKS